MNSVSILAMGGGAEAAVMISLLIGWGILAFVFGLCAIAAATAKRWLVWTSATFFFLFCLFIVPWEGYLYELSPDALEDPDAVMWHQRGCFNCTS